jgi:guanylate kinase
LISRGGKAIIEGLSAEQDEAMEGSSDRNTGAGREGVLLVVSGPSGVGKGTVINRVLDDHPEVRRSVSCTTRTPRPGEADGDHYHFISVEEFVQRRDACEFLEWASVYEGLYYGTPKSPVEEAIGQGKDIIFEIDYQGARSVRTQMPGRAVLVFIAPPTWQALVDRLQGRQTEHPEALAERIATARREIENMGMFEYVLVNDEVEGTAAELEAILVGERNRLGRVGYQTLRDRLLAEAAGAASAAHDEAGRR